MKNLLRSHLRLLLAATAIAGLPVAAFAAATAAPLPQSAPAATEAPPLSKGMEAKLDQHIDSLHEQLAITPAEQTQWDGFAQVMRDNAAAMHAAVDERAKSFVSMNAADNMKSYAELARVHADNMQKLAQSFESLYSDLSADQKKIADGVFRHDEAKHRAMHKQAG
jgi:hypothetical protein